MCNILVFKSEKRIIHQVAVILLAAIACIFVSCASSPRGGYAAKAFDKAYDEGDYSYCAQMRMEQSDGGEKIDFVLDAAMLQHAAGDWDASRADFEISEQRIDEAFTKSITRGVGATLFNDNIKEYPGNIYEYLLLNAFNSLNYYNQGDLEGAMVEIRKLDVKNKEYVNQYGEVALSDDSEDDDGSTGSALSMAGVSMGDIMSRSPKKPTEADVYRDSALVRYLGLVFRTMYGDTAGNNEIDGRYLAALNGDFATATQDELRIPKDQGRLDVLSLTGRIAARQAAYKEFPLGMLAILAPNLLMAVGDPSLFNLTFGFPVYVPQDETVVPVEVVVTSSGANAATGAAGGASDAASGATQTSDGTVDIASGADGAPPPIYANGESGGANAAARFPIAMKKLESFDEAVRKDVTVKARRAYVRSIYRSASKKITTIATSEASLVAAQASDNDLAVLIAQTTAATAIRGALAALDKSEVPDTRQCTQLPQSAWAGGVDVPPGTYTVTVRYSNGAVHTRQGIVVRRGKITLIEEVCVK